VLLVLRLLVTRLLVKGWPGGLFASRDGFEGQLLNLVSRFLSVVRNVP